MASFVNELMADGALEQGEFAVAPALPRPLDLARRAHLCGETANAIGADSPRGTGHALEVWLLVRVHARIARAVRLADSPSQRKRVRIFGAVDTETELGGPFRHPICISRTLCAWLDA